MSWEVLIMKFKTSFFHKGLALNLLRRCWPVWLAYLALMIFEFPMNIYGNMQSWRGPLPDLADMLANNILHSACSAAEISFFACIVVVMAVFGYLYNMRTCGMINAFPVRRETVFCTFALTGLVPMLLADCLAALLTVVLIGNAAPAGTVAQWLSMAVMSNVAFYGFGVFCAMLTGSLFILPLVYLVLNLRQLLWKSACTHCSMFSSTDMPGRRERFPGFLPAMRFFVIFMSGMSMIGRASVPHIRLKTRLPLLPIVFSVWCFCCLPCCSTGSGGWRPPGTRWQFRF